MVARNSGDGIQSGCSHCCLLCIQIITKWFKYSRASQERRQRSIGSIVNELKEEQCSPLFPFTTVLFSLNTFTNEANSLNSQLIIKFKNYMAYKYLWSFSRGTVFMCIERDMYFWILDVPQAAQIKIYILIYKYMSLYSNDKNYTLSSVLMPRTVPISWWQCHIWEATVIVWCVFSLVHEL